MRSFTIYILRHALNNQRMRFRWTAHTALAGEIRNSYGNLVSKSEDKDDLGEADVH
jgi:hypothetical protein